ncbi:Hypothetical_protein [Hexamita inflata]|uniref:Hypothetical_protein n=1 Tax=Hexamita inflata TaxID=28002 RepID=A0ABP1GGW7_9EUKA
MSTGPAIFYQIGALCYQYFRHPSRTQWLVSIHNQINSKCNSTGFLESLDQFHANMPACDAARFHHAHAGNLLINSFKFQQFQIKKFSFLAQWASFQRYNVKIFIQLVSIGILIFMLSLKSVSSAACIVSIQKHTKYYQINLNSFIYLFIAVNKIKLLISSCDVSQYSCNNFNLIYRKHISDTIICIKSKNSNQETITTSILLINQMNIYITQVGRQVPSLSTREAKRLALGFSKSISLCFSSRWIRYQGPH